MNKETPPSESETTFALILTIMYHLKYAKSILVLIFHEYLNYFVAADFLWSTPTWAKKRRTMDRKIGLNIIFIDIGGIKQQGCKVYKMVIQL